jgi:hypothetical protein
LMILILLLVVLGPFVAVAPMVAVSWFQWPVPASQARTRRQHRRAFFVTPTRTAVAW